MTACRWKMQQIKGYFIFIRKFRPRGVFLCPGSGKTKNPALGPDNISNLPKYDYNVNNFSLKLTIFCVLHNSSGKILYFFAAWKSAFPVVYLRHRKDDTRCTDNIRSPNKKRRKKGWVNWLTFGKNKRIPHEDHPA